MRTGSAFERQHVSTGQRFRPVRAGVERLPARYNLPRHQHLDSYATVVLEGRFVEAGFAGRARAIAGVALLHGVLDVHADQMLSAGARILRLPWPSTLEGAFQVRDPDFLVRVAERDPQEAAAALMDDIASSRHSAHRCNDWPDLLANGLAARDMPELRVWAKRHHVRPETLSRGFRAAYGCSPSTYRLQLRARRAWSLVTHEQTPLATIAAETGFADHAHMSRAVKMLTGRTPSDWRQDCRNSASSQ